jgi:glycolate oxidase FAD binding subunit
VTTLAAETVLAPADEDEARAIAAEAAAAKRRLAIAGGQTRRGLGRPVETDAVLSSERLTGIVFYEPAELVIGVKSGTRVDDIETALAEHGQMLAFEPMDHRALYGTNGEPTIGGVAATNASGPRRIAVGAARDALLGVRLVNGHGEAIKSGGRVMKNVTGLDLVKLTCGSHGTLGFFTELTFKVLPKPERASTLVLRGLSDEEAVAAMSAALGSPYAPSGAVHLPAGIGDGEARTILRIEGFSESVDNRLAALSDLLRRWAPAEIEDGDASPRFWASVRDVRPLAEPRDRAIWRLSTVPSRAAEVTAAVRAQQPDARWFYDWGGGLIWLSLPADRDAGAAAVRSAIAAASGHATLVRAPDATRLSVPVFQPQPPALEKLAAGLKRAFDPEGIFQPGRMYAGTSR